MADSTVTYRYFVTNIVTNEVIAELPLTGVSYEKAVKDAGSFSGTLSLSQETEGIDVYNATMPGKNAIYVLRNGECVWGGPIWSRSYDVVSKSISINANEFTSYYQHRKIWKTWDLSHNGTVVYVDPNDSSQLIVELNPDTKDTIDIDEGIAVELAFTDKKGYNLNGHFRVNDTFRNATQITVDKEALQWNVFGVDHTFKTKGDKLTVAKREVKAGSKEVIITTDNPHLLAEGDEVAISKLESDVPVATYNTYKTLSTEYPVAALASTSTLLRYGTATSGSFTITNTDTKGLSKGAIITQQPHPTLSTDKAGVVPSLATFTATVTNVINATAFTFSSYNVGSSTNTPASRTGPVFLKLENKKTGYGLSYKTSTGEITYTLQPKDYSWKGKIKAGTHIITNGIKAFSGAAEDPYFGKLPDYQTTYNAGTVTNGNDVLTISSTSGLMAGYVVEKQSGTAAFSDTKIAEILNGTQIRVEKAPTGNGTLVLTIRKISFHIVDKILTADSPKDMYSYYSLRNGTDYVGVPALQFKRKIGQYNIYPYNPPTVDGTFNIIDIDTHEFDYTKSVAAVCANGNGQPVVKVIDRKTFVVNSSCEAKYDNTSTNQDTATIAWDGRYQATMYTHTDTYEQVRYFLGKVHEDFVTVEANNPFLGNLEKYQIRTAKYDPVTDLATITTGFQQPVFSKRIYFDYASLKIKARISLYDPYSQFDLDKDVGEIVKITGSDSPINGSFYITAIQTAKSYIEYNLNSAEQDIEGRPLSTVSADGSYITFTTSSAHGIRAGNLVTVGGLSVTALNVDNALVVDTPTSTTIRIASTVANGTTDTTPNSSIFTSDRLVATTRLAPNSSVITFGAHDLSAGNNFELVGLSKENYDGVWEVNSVLDDVTFTYKPRFESLRITDVKVDYVGGDYLVTAKLSKKPNFKSYSYIPKYTKISVAGLGSPYDSPTSPSPSYWTLNEYYEKKFSNGTTGYYFTYKITGAAGTVQIHPFRTVDYSERKYGTAYTVSSASYVRELTGPKGNRSPSGRGISTFTTSPNHSFTANQKVVISNIGGEFTQKTANTNAYSEYVVTVSTAPTANTFTVSNEDVTQNESLWKLVSNQNPAIGQANTSITPTGATAIAYDSSRKFDSYATLKIDDLPDVTTASLLTTTVTGKAFNAKTKTVYLRLTADEGFVAGQKVIITDVDDYKDTIFDGTYTIVSFGKVDNVWQLTYKSLNKKYKKNIGTFDSKNELTKYLADTSASPGKATVDAAIYVGSYGSYMQNSDIGLEFSTYEDSGNYQRVPTYRGDKLKNVGEYLSEYSDKYIVKPNSTKIIRNVYGFEYRIDCVYNPATSSFRRIFKFLPINYPNAPVHGEVSPPSRFGADKFVFEYPGNISSVSLEESAEEASTRFFMVGSDGGTGTSDASKSYIGVAHKSLIADSWPMLDATESNDKLDYLNEISENAYRYLNETKPPSGVFQIGVVGNLDPIVNTYQPGDWCSIIVNDKFVQDRLASDLEPRNDVIVRKILSYSVDVPDAPSTPESVTLSLITEWDVDNRGQ
jgi:hypothetical protein